MENTELDTAVLNRMNQRMKLVFKTNEDALNFFLENVKVNFRCNLCRRPQSGFKFKCCRGKQNVFEEHKFLVDVERNRINRMPFIKSLASFYFCYHLYLLYGDSEEFKAKINFYIFHTFVANFYKTTFHFKKKKFRNLDPLDYKKYNKLFESLAEKLNALEC
jgi:hypothetical protein